jgi:hypothetical protein
MEEQERVESPEESASTEPLEATDGRPQGKKKQQKSVFEKPDNSIFSRKAELQYRLSLYRSNGMIRGDIKKATLTQAGAMYGDLMRCIPSNQWSTIDEICDLVWEFERKSYRKSFSRTRRQIEEGIELLLEGDIVQSR